MAYVSFFLAAVLFTLPVIWMNNYELIMECERMADRIHCWLAPRRNSIASGVLGVAGSSVLAIVSYVGYDNPFLHTLKQIFVYIWLIPVTYIDGKKQRIPNSWILYGMVSGAAFWIIEGITGGGWLPLLGDALFGGVMGGGVLFVSAVMSKGGIGMGDVKLYAVLGVIGGWQRGLNLMFIALIGAMVYGLFMIAAKKMTRKSLIPMGPFTFAAMVAMILSGG